MSRIIVSRCLGFEACRWDGKIVEAPWLKELASKAELIPVCPERDIGLGVPRKPINLIKDVDGVKVIQDETCRDVTEELVSFSEGYLRHVKDVDAFILKSKSPSCGYQTTKIHENGKISTGSGVFASMVREIYPDALIVDEIFFKENRVDAFLSSL